MILVYVDIFGSEEEIPRYTEYLKEHSIIAQVTDDPSVYMSDAYKYSHVFLDYGGLNMPGNSLFEDHCREADRAIVDNPNVTFVIISCMGKDWFEREMDNLKEPNVVFMESFLDAEELHKILGFEYVPEVIDRTITKRVDDGMTPTE